MVVNNPPWPSHYDNITITMRMMAVISMGYPEEGGIHPHVLLFMAVNNPPWLSHYPRQVQVRALA